MFTSVLEATGPSVNTSASSISFDDEESSTLNRTKFPSSKLPSTSPQVQRRKISYSGNIPVRKPINFVILSDTVPWWLLALGYPSVKSIVLFGFLDYSTLETIMSRYPFGPTFLRVFERFRHKLLFCTSTKVSHDTLVLLSGFIRFLTSHRIFEEHSVHNWIFICSDIKKYRNIPVSGYEFHRISHKHHGGPTDIETLYSSSMPSFRCDKSPLRRSVGDFVDFSIRPTPISTASPTSRVILHSSILPARGDLLLI